MAGAAVCITGQARSFGEIGHNIREGVFLLHNTARIDFFGVRPASDNWHDLHRMLPLVEVAIQRRCWRDSALNLTKQWLHCDMRARSHDCRASFLQQLCDLEACENLITAHERRIGSAYETLMRLRPDLFWEAAVRLPAKLDAQTVFVPASDSQGGVNDHLAIGLRAPMRLYFTRLRHVDAAGHAALAMVAQRLDGPAAVLRGRTGEGHLRLSLAADGLAVRRLTTWALCLHTRLALASRSGFRGCVGRVRCRSPCASLVCAESGFKSGNCECYNETCKTLGAGRHVATVPFEPPRVMSRRGVHLTDRFRHLALRQFGLFGLPTERLPRKAVKRGCVDVRSSQLFHPQPCPSSHAAFALHATHGEARAAATCGGCDWPRHPASGAPLAFARLEELPACILGDAATRGASSSRVVAQTQACLAVTRRSVFAGTADFWPDSRGVWPLRGDITCRALWGRERCDSRGVPKKLALAS